MVTFYFQNRQDYNRKKAMIMTDLTFSSISFQPTHDEIKNIRYETALDSLDWTKDNTKGRPRQLINNL